MKNKDNQIVCDTTHTILNDGVTIVPDYIEIIDNKMYKVTSDDPNNKIDPLTLAIKLRQAKMDEEDIEEECDKYIINNRVEYIKKTFVGKVDNKNLNGKHFYNFLAMNEYTKKG